jgi:importin subunit beta-1
MIDYLNELREGVLEAFTGIVQGLKGDGNSPSPDVQLLEPHVLFIVQFITLVAQDTDHSDGNVAASAGLVG